MSIKKSLITTLLLLTATVAFAQDSLHLSLSEAIHTGVDSSKKILLAQAKVQEAINQYAQAKDQQLPDIKASLMASQAFILTRTLQIKDLMKEPLHLPATSTMYIGTFGINEAIFAGHKMRYAKQSAQLMQQVADLEKTHDTQGVILSVIQAYINLYKIDQNSKIIQKSIHDIEGRLKETQQFKAQGLATTNDVLRFQLEKAQAQLSLIDLKNNRAVANYALVTLLGLPENTLLQVDSVGQNVSDIPPLKHFTDQALSTRKDLQVYGVQKKINRTHIKSIKADKLPVLGAGINTYYVNPNSQFIPPKHGFLVPATVGLNLSWHISELYMSKNKVSAARIKAGELDIARQATVDEIRMDVNKNYHAYLQSLQRIKVLQTAVDQARENDRIMELKYKNQLATTTDRIDAQTLLYTSLVNLGLARAEAAQTWYQLQAATGTLNTHF